MTDYFDNAPANPEAPRGQMAGFDAEFADIVDYILRITYRIWEGKQVGLCYDYYSEDCPVYTLAGLTTGSEEVVQNTIKTLTAFPDRRLHADNIIWGGDAQSGFHSSHRINTTMTNLGPSEFGPATGQKAEFQVIAHCVCKDNRIIEEWLVRDNYLLAEQLGVDPHEAARRFATNPMPADCPFEQWRVAEIARVSSQDRARAEYDEPQQRDPQRFVCAALHNIWNARLLGECQHLYADDAQFHGSARREFVGAEEIVRFYTAMLGSLPDARWSQDYVCAIPWDGDGLDIAVRWTLAGTHSGAALWGEPTGAPILVLGESHYRVKDGRVIEEWTVFDELAILTQVHRARETTPCTSNNESSE